MKFSNYQSALLILIWVSIGFYFNDAFGQTTGDYRAAATGSWSSLTTWERWDGSAWVTPTSEEGYPGQLTLNPNVTIRNGRTVTLNVTPANAIGSVTIGENGGSSGNLYLRSTAGRTLIVSGDVNVEKGQILALKEGLAVTHNLRIGGNLIVNIGGTIDMISPEVNNKVFGNVYLIGTNQSLGGGGFFSFYYLYLQNNGTVSLTSTLQEVITLSLGSNSILDPAPDVTFNTVNTYIVYETITGSGQVNVTRVGSNPTYSGQYVFHNDYLGNITVNYSGAGNQTISSGNSKSLKTSGSGIKTMSSTMQLTKDFSVGEGTTVLMGANGIQFVNRPSGGYTVNVNGTLDFNHPSGYCSANQSATLTMGPNGLIKTFDNYGLGPVSYASFQGIFNTTSISTQGTIEYYRDAGSQTVTDRSYNNLIISGAAQTKTWTLSANRTINGNLTINNGAPFTIAGSGTRVIYAKGGWTNHGIFTPGTHTVIFNGLAAQTIGGSSPTTFNNLTIDNAQGISLGANVTAGGLLTMIAGNINCGTNILELGTSATSTGNLAFTSGTIIGKFRRWAAAGNTVLNLHFPVGTIAQYRSIHIDFPAVNRASGGYLTTEFISSDPGTTGLPQSVGGVEITHVSPTGYWSVVNNGISGGSYTATLDASGFTYSNGVTPISDLANVRLIKRPDVTGMPWESSVTTGGTHNAPLGMNTVSASGLTTFSSFGVGLGCLLITEQPLSTQTVCQYQTPATLSVTPSNPVNTTYEWFFNSVNSNTGGTSTGVYTASFVPPTSSNGATYYYCVVSRPCGTGTSNTAEVIVGAMPPVSLGSNPIVCQGAAEAYLAYTSGGGGLDQYSIDYDGPANTAGFADVFQAALPSSPLPLTIPYPIAPGAYNASITFRNSSSGCESEPSYFTVTIVAEPAAPTATKSPNEAIVCPGEMLTVVNVTDNGGGWETCVIQYRYNTGSGFSNWSTTVPHFLGVPGVNTIEIRKACDGLGCESSEVSSYSWAVLDDSPPTVSYCPGNITLYTSSDGGVDCSVALIYNTPLFDDNCDGENIPGDHTTGPLSNSEVSATGSPYTVTFQYSDNSGNGPAICAFTVTVIDNEPPMALCLNLMVQLGFDGFAYIMVEDVDGGSMDNCGDIELSTSSNLEFNSSHMGSGNTVLMIVTDDHELSSSCEANITVNGRETYLEYEGDLSGQYSDPVGLSATLKDLLTGQGIGNRQLTFTIGAQTATATTNSLGTATASILLNQPPTNVNGASYTVQVDFTPESDDHFYGYSYTNDFSILREDAVATYTGVYLASTGGVNNSEATVLLSATIQDFSDGYPGDISMARVRFVECTNDECDEFNFINTVPIPVALFNPANTTIGGVIYEWDVDLGSKDWESYTIKVIVEHYYSEESDLEEITVSRPLDNFITGGGFVILENSYGTYAGDPGSRCNFSLNGKFNQNGNSPKGKVQLIVRRTESGVLRTYRIKSNQITSVGLDPITNTGTISGKCNFLDITDPDNPVEVPNGGSRTFQLNAEDNGTPGELDLIAFTAYGPNGEIWFSTKWNNVQSIPQNLDGGNIEVHSNSGNYNYTGGGSEQAQGTMTFHTDASLHLFPNPAYNYLDLVIQSPGEKEMWIDILDQSGKRMRSSAVQLQSGSNSLQWNVTELPSGLYYIRLYGPNTLIIEQFIKIGK